MTSPLDRTTARPRHTPMAVGEATKALASRVDGQRGDTTTATEADPALFEALVSQASGQLVKELPVGPAAMAWARWKPPTEALGVQAPSGSAAKEAPLANVAGNGAELSSPVAATTTDTFQAVGPGATGTVFGRAVDAAEAVVNLAAALTEADLGQTTGGAGNRGAQLVELAYRDLGVGMPSTISDQATMGVEVPALDRARPGDLLFFGDPAADGEVALYAGDNRMVRSGTGANSAVVEIDRPVGSIRRIVTPLSGNAPVPAGSPLSASASAGTPGANPLSLTGKTFAEVPIGPAVDVLDQPGLAGEVSAPTDSKAKLEGLPFTDLFVEAGTRWNVDPALLAAVAEVESGFETDAVSPAGAQGLMQFMPATAAEMNVDPWNPASAIDGAARYLRQSLDLFDDVSLALASYNAGRGAVQRHGGIPPYTETQNYVRKVMDAWRNR